ncbi:MAG: hypothetical protein KC492_08275, partial [Myxococcales bacterium]|nr:hypothetical protein [Myxococcales bacterium]
MEQSTAHDFSLFSASLNFIPDFHDGIFVDDHFLFPALYILIRRFQRDVQARGADTMVILPHCATLTHRPEDVHLADRFVGYECVASHYFIYVHRRGSRLVEYIDSYLRDQTTVPGPFVAQVTQRLLGRGVILPPDCVHSFRRDARQQPANSHGCSLFAARALCLEIGVPAVAAESLLAVQYDAFSDARLRVTLKKLFAAFCFQFMRGTDACAPALGLSDVTNGAQAQQTVLHCVSAFLPGFVARITPIFDFSDVPRALAPPAAHQPHPLLAPPPPRPVLLPPTPPPPGNDDGASSAPQMLPVAPPPLVLVKEASSSAPSASALSTCGAAALSPQMLDVLSGEMTLDDMSMFCTVAEYLPMVPANQVWDCCQCPIHSAARLCAPVYQFHVHTFTCWKRQSCPYCRVAYPKMAVDKTQPVELVPNMEKERQRQEAIKKQRAKLLHNRKLLAQQAAQEAAFVASVASEVAAAKRGDAAAAAPAAASSSSTAPAAPPAAPKPGKMKFQSKSSSQLPGLDVDIRPVPTTSASSDGSAPAADPDMVELRLPVLRNIVGPVKAASDEPHFDNFNRRIDPRVIVWVTRRTPNDIMVVSYNPVLTRMFGCNNNLEFIGSSSVSAHGVVMYMANYMCKEDLSLKDALAMVKDMGWKALNSKSTAEDKDTAERQNNFAFQLMANGLLRLVEISSTTSASIVLGESAFQSSRPNDWIHPHRAVAICRDLFGKPAHARDVAAAAGSDAASSASADARGPHIEDLMQRYEDEDEEEVGRAEVLSEFFRGLFDDKDMSIIAEALRGDELGDEEDAARTLSAVFGPNYSHVLDALREQEQQNDEEQEGEDDEEQQQPDSEQLSADTTDSDDMVTSDSGDDETEAASEQPASAGRRRARKSTSPEAASGATTTTTADGTNTDGATSSSGSGTTSSGTADSSSASAPSLAALTVRRGPEQGIPTGLLGGFRRRGINANTVEGLENGSSEEDTDGPAVNDSADDDGRGAPDRQLIAYASTTRPRRGEAAAAASAAAQVQQDPFAAAAAPPAAGPAP